MLSSAQIRWFVQFRWLELLTQALIFVLLTFLSQNLMALIGFGVVLLVSIAVTFVVTFRSKLLNQKIISLVLLLDIIILALMLYFSGGANNPFSLFFITQVSLGAILVGERWTWLLAIVSSFCYGLLFIFSVELPALSPHGHAGHEPFSLHLQGMWLAFSILAATQAAFFTKIVRALSEREAELRELALKAQRSERLAAVTALAASAAHELNTPLSGIKLSAEEIVDKLEQKIDLNVLKEDAFYILSEVTRCSEILKRLRQEAGDLEGQVSEEISFEEIVSEVRARLSGKGAERIKVAETALELSVHGPKRPLIEAICALTKNALESAPGALVKLSVTRNVKAQQVLIKDNGGGIAPDIIGRVGEPFFTTKEGGRGLGLGVFLARSFVEKLGGSLGIKSELGVGTEAILNFPVTHAS